MVDKVQKDSLRMINDGMLLGIVNDVRPKGKLQFLQNARTYVEGIIESRPRLGDFLTFAVNPDVVPHSIKIIINKANSTFNRIVGADTKLYSTATSSLAVKDTGYSGNPFFIVDFRPENAIEAYAYITEGSKFVKLSVSNILSDVGLTAPAMPATWKIGKPVRKIVDNITTGSDTDWNNLTGSAGAPSLQTRINTTITKYIADETVPAFASIVPAAMTADLQKDSIVLLKGITTVIIEEVLPAALNTGVATISKITYDSGTSGLCTIVLDISSTDIVRNSILLLNGTEYVRVIDVVLDGNNIPSIRTSTTGTFAATNTVSGAASFRFYDTVGGYTAADAIASQSLKSSIGASGVSSITHTFNVDLKFADGRALSDDDIFHISTLLSSSALITEYQIQMDVDTTTNDFTKNYFFFAVSPSTLNSAVAQTAPLIAGLQQGIQQDQILNDHILRNQETDPYGRDGLLVEDPTNIYSGIRYSTDTIQDASLGASQWTELRIRLGDFIRVGADTSRTLKDVKAIRISVNASAAVDLYIDSLWVGGADALNSTSQGFLPYNYVYQIYDPATRVISNWSPPLRTGIKIERGRVVLSFLDANSTYANTYKIRIARFGGSLNDFRILGTIKNDGSTYTDTSSDRLIADNELAGRYEQQSLDAVFDYYQPFAILDTPKRGVCNVVGTKFTRVSGDTLSLTYPRGTLIVIDGVANRFYSNPSTTGIVELENDMGALTNVVFEMDAPLLTGQVLPVIFGPYGEGNSGLYVFGFGDPNAAGRLYWLDGNSPDTQSDLNWVDICSPSEPLVAGVMYDGYPQIYSTKRSWTILPTQEADGSTRFIGRLNANGRGVFSKYAIDVTPSSIYFISENADGIYKVEGNGNPQNITAAGFDNLFYVNGKAPSTIVLVDGTIIYPPDYIATTELRIFCTNDFVHFRFKDTNGGYRVIVIDAISNNIVSYDTYPSDKINAIYREETETGYNVLAATLNAIKKYGSTGTFENAIETKVIPFALDSGDSHSFKEYKEIVTNVNRGTGGLTLRNYYDNGLTNDSLVTLSASDSTREQIVTNLQDAEGKGKLAQNITTIFTWTLNALVKLYEESIYFEPLGDVITDRSASPEFGEGVGDKLWQGVVIEANTFGLDKILEYYDDNNVLKATLTINHNGRETIAYSFNQPFISHSIRRTSSDGVEWLSLVEAYVYDPEPESASVWEGEINLSELSGLILIKRCGIAYRSTSDAIITFYFSDGTIFEHTLISSASNWTKDFFYIEANKIKGLKYRIESEDGEIRLYKKHLEIWAKSINSQGDFQRIQPFGGPSNITEITI